MSAVVGIVMGSASDRAVMAKAEEVLKEFGIEYELRILSAHRTPDETRAWVLESERTGVKVFIAAAGLAAHLAGAVAAHTTLPVIGVPLAAPTGAIAGGLDSLLSTVQMPGGIPVACVAIGEAGARNAGFLAAQMLSLADPSLQTKIKAQRRAAADKILAG